MSEPTVKLIIERDKVTLSINNQPRVWLIPEGIQEYTSNSVINHAIRNQVNEEVREKIREHLRGGDLTTWHWSNV